MISLEGFNDNLGKWRDCELSIDVSSCTTGAIASGDCKLERGKDCSSLDPRQNVPDFNIMALYYISPDFIIILFGIMFGFTFVRQLLKDAYKFIKFQIKHPCSKYILQDSDEFALGKTQTADPKTVLEPARVKSSFGSSLASSMVAKSSTRKLTGGMSTPQMPKTESHAKLEKQISLMIPEQSEGEVSEISSADMYHNQQPNPMASRIKTNEFAASELGDNMLLILERDARELEELATII